MMNDETTEELIMAHHILLATLCGALNTMLPSAIDGLRAALTEKLALCKTDHPQLEAATARALTLVPASLL